LKFAFVDQDGSLIIGCSVVNKGTVNEKMISCCRPPFYRAVDSELLKEVNAQMERAMLLLYKMMLNGHQNGKWKDMEPKR
jgi:hypothetical protein